MIIAATSDIHSPKNFDLFVKSIEKLNLSFIKPDIFLFAGDIVDRGNVPEYTRVHNVLFGKINCPIVACFGNSEFGPEQTEQMKKNNPDIIFLEDESIILEINGKKVGIVGTKGSLDIPTSWQSRNIPDIEEQYKRRIEKIDKLLSELEADFKILLMHYTPTYKILEGEEPWRYPQMGSKKFEEVILRNKPNLVICGHSHRGKKQVWIDTVPIFNAALALNKEVIVIDTEKDLKPGLEKFL